MENIPNYKIFRKIKPIHKGWSDDKKYYVETKDGERLLLRISDISSYEKKQQEFDIMKKIAAIGIKMSLPIAFGVCENEKSVYQLLSWCDGQEAKEVLYHLNDAEQYAFGQKAAIVLKQMETIDYKPVSMEWSKIYQVRLERYIELYRKCGYTFEGDELIISYLQTQRYCIGERPTALMHEDVWCGRPLSCYDWCRSKRHVQHSLCYGTDRGYFGKSVPEDFWGKYNYYMIAEMLYAFTVGANMEREREETLHMFDDEVEFVGLTNSAILP